MLSISGIIQKLTLYITTIYVIMWELSALYLNSFLRGQCVIMSPTWVVLISVGSLFR